MVDPADHDQLCRAVGGDRRDCLLSAHASAGGAARSAWVNGGADAVVGGRDDRCGLDHAAGGVAVGRQGRVPAVGAAGGGQRSEPGGQCRRRAADGYRPGDRRVAVVRPDCVLRAAHAPSTPRCGSRLLQGAVKAVTRLGGEPGDDRCLELATTSRPGRRGATSQRSAAGREVRQDAWRWALDNRAEDGSLPPGSEIARQSGRHERWGRMVKRSGLAGQLDPQS